MGGHQLGRNNLPLCCMHYATFGTRLSLPDLARCHNNTLIIADNDSNGSRQIETQTHPPTCQLANLPQRVARTAAMQLRFLPIPNGNGQRKLRGQLQLQLTLAVAVATLVALTNSGHRYERQLSVCRIMMLPFLQQPAPCSILWHLQRQQVFIDINTRRSKYAECFSGQRTHCGCGATADVHLPQAMPLASFCGNPKAAASTNDITSSLTVCLN